MRELELRIYECPIDVISNGGVMSYTIFGNLNEVVRQMEKLRYEEPKADFYYRTSRDSDEVYLCRRMRTKKYSFYDPMERRGFMLPFVDLNLRISFFTFDEKRMEDWNSIKPNLIEELNLARRKWARRRALLLSLGIASGVSALLTLEHYVSFKSFSILTFLPFMFVGWLVGLLEGRIHSSPSKRAATLSILEEEIRRGESVSCVEHPELRDLYEALSELRELSLPKPYTKELLEVYREVKRRLRAEGNPWAINLYTLKAGYRLP